MNNNGEHYINCVWCKEQVVSTATVCPHCRRNPKSKFGDRIALIIIAFILFLLFVFPIL